MPVVTLVHGTFGRLPGADAAWTRESSPLRRALRDQLGDEIIFTTFRWSGMNWPSARYRAAHRLCTHLRQLGESYPDRQRYVVAHSHGGNVAMYALRDLERDSSAPRVHGVVCLSTPFIAAQPRQVTTFRFVATFAVLLVTFFAGLANVMGWLLAPWIARVNPDDPLLHGLVLNEVWLEFLLCALLAWIATKRLVSLARSRYEKISVPPLRTPIRIIRSVGDEASALLATGSFFSWLVTLAWGVASTITIGIAAIFTALLSSPVLVPVAAALLVERVLRRDGARRALLRILRDRRVGAGLATLGILAALAT